mmetsp:Transcript_44503/g.71526  ORF Transcript_44503/g.71526 Transcript_44503/m.71526 type:complete len:243 (+) Transcript_44503:136-864(+)
MHAKLDGGPGDEVTRSCHGVPVEEGGGAKGRNWEEEGKCERTMGKLEDIRGEGEDRIFAFEPVPRIFEVLSRNLQGVQGLVPKRFGLAAQASVRTPFFFFEDCPGESTRRLEEGQRQRAIVNPQASAGVPCVGELRVLSEVMRQENIQKVQLLKVDVEGDELDVLMGLHDCDWPKIQQVAVEVHDIEFRVSRIRALLERHGFKVQIEEQKTAWHDGMLICVPKDLLLYYVYASRPCTGRDVS